MRSLAKSRLSLAIAALATVAVAIALNTLADAFRIRVDVTQDRAHTLSAGTKGILESLSLPVQLRLYASLSDAPMPPSLKAYVRRIEDLLEEMQKASGGRLEVLRLTPAPDSDAEASARLDGIESQRLPNGGHLFLGISATQLDRKAAIPFLAPERERLLEYDIVRAIAQVNRDARVKVGILSALRVRGGPPLDPAGERPRPWALLEELQRDFDLVDIPLNARKIPADVGVLLIIHPRRITVETQFAIDQFLMRGGRLVAFLDPHCVFEGGRSPAADPGSSTLDRLLPAWGIGFQTEGVLADLELEGKARQGQIPALLDLGPDFLNREDVLTSGLDSLLVAFAGPFTILEDADPSLRRDILFHSSGASQLVDPQTARDSREAIVRDFVKSGREMPLGLRLTGKFKTAFPEGMPGNGGANFLRESTTETTVLLVGDADMLHDPLCVTEAWGLFPNGRMILPTNGNLALAQGAIEQLAGDPDLIAVRSRSIRRRPFTVIHALQAAAEEKYQATIRDLEKDLEETRRRLEQLGQGKQEHYLLTPAQQQEIAKFREQEATVDRQLKEARRQLRAEIDALADRILWWNLVVVPTAAALLFLVWGIWRRRRLSPR